MSDAPVSLLGLTNHDAEVAVLHAMRMDINAAIDLAQLLTPTDFYEPRHALVFEAISTLLMGVEPVDTAGILAECRGLLRERKLKHYIDAEYIDGLVGGGRTPRADVRQHGQASGLAAAGGRFCLLAGAGVAGTAPAR